MRQVLAVWVACTALLLGDTWSFGHDNDFFFNSDDAYTGGIHLAWTGPEYALTRPGTLQRGGLDALSAAVGLLRNLDGKRRCLSVTMHELIVTPEDINETAPVYDDVPYAGILALNVSLFAWTHRMFEEFGLGVGILGPASGAEAVQKTVHRLNGNGDPKGWDNQIPNRLFIHLDYLRGVRQFERHDADGRRLEWFNSAFATLGNFYTGIGAGTVLRYGRNLPNNFAAASALISYSQNHHLEFDARPDGWGWGVSGGVFVNAAAYNYLSETSDRLGYTYDRPSLIVTGRLGLDLYYDRFLASIELYPMGKITKKAESSSWGRINFTWAY